MKTTVTMSTPTPILWKLFLEIFRGGDENIVVGYHYGLSIQTRTAIEMFPECKQFLYEEFQKDDIEFLRELEIYGHIYNERKAKQRQEELVRLEKEMKEISKRARGWSWTSLRWATRRSKRRQSQQIITKNRKIWTVPHRISIKPKPKIEL